VLLRALHFFVKNALALNLVLGFQKVQQPKTKNQLTKFAKHKFANTIVTVLFDRASFSFMEIKTVRFKMIPNSARAISMKTSQAPKELGSLFVKYG